MTDRDPKTNIYVNITTGVMQEIYYGGISVSSVMVDANDRTIRWRPACELEKEMYHMGFRAIPDIFDL